MRFLTGLALGLTLLGTAWADDFQGAAVVLEQAAKAKPAPALKPAEKPDDANTILRRDAEAFGKAAAGLAPEEAAAQWLALADRVAATDPDDPDGMMNRWRPGTTNETLGPITLAELVRHLPPPAAWPALRQAVEARPAGEKSAAKRRLVLLMLAHTLNNDPDAQHKDIEQLHAVAKTLDPMSKEMTKGQLEQLAAAMTNLSSDPEFIVAAFEQQLSRAERGDQSWRIDVPDLVTLIGAEKAQPLLRRALKTSTSLIIDYAEPTLALARRLAVETVDESGRPRWELVNDTGDDSIRLYEALEKKFPAEAAGEEQAHEIEGPANLAADLVRSLVWSATRGRGAGRHYDQRGRREAQAYYLLALVTHERIDDATALISQLASDPSGAGFQLPYSALDSLDRAGFTGQVADLFHQLLEKNPELPLWDQYVSLASRSDRASRMLDLAKLAAQREGLTPEQKLTILGHLATALLAADEVDQAVLTIEQVIALKQADKDNQEVLSQAMTLARLGHVLGRPEWVERGLALIREKMAKPGNPEAMGFDIDHYDRLSVVQLLTDLGRGPEAEALLASQLATAAHPSMARQNDWGRHNPGSEGLANALSSLAWLYHQSGRHGDVLTLLEQAPYWGVGDLAQLDDNFNPYADDDQPLAFAAAAALADAGRREEALKILETVLEQNSGFDPAYELLVSIVEPENAALRLNSYFARDPFEERPLIWLASLQLKQGDLDAAEQSARKAISIDPSDGEQGRGDRMRVYAVLSDILRSKGDAKQADFFQEVVKAIRLSEDADRLYSSGLLTRGVAMYREALKHFADAYCIQSRLAVQLSNLGRHEEAAEHYRKAYELMPDSFGRMESHCFGCEGVFRGEKAQSIAEEVFVRLAKEKPNQPQVHYLLGYLRETQGRHQEAGQSFARAVELDPDYLNAWEKLQGLASNIHLPPEQRDAASLNLLRLDPLQRHVRADLGNVRDLAALWRAAENAIAMRVPPAEKLLTLTASQAQLEREEAERKRLQETLGARADMVISERFDQDWDNEFWDKAVTPADFIAKHNIVRQIVAME